MGSSSPGREKGVPGEGTRRRRQHSSEEHKETLESVSNEAFRMREIKDDLTAVLQRLRHGDALSGTAVVEPARSPLLDDGEGGGGGGNNEENDAVAARGFYGTDALEGVEVRTTIILISFVGFLSEALTPCIDPTTVARSREHARTVFFACVCVL